MMVWELERGGNRTLRTGSVPACQGSRFRALPSVQKILYLLTGSLKRAACVLYMSRTLNWRAGSQDAEYRAVPNKAAATRVDRTNRGRPRKGCISPIDLDRSEPHSGQAGRATFCPSLRGLPALHSGWKPSCYGLGEPAPGTAESCREQ